MKQYFYQGRQVTFLGQLGDSIYEIQDTSSGDPQRCLNRGRTFTVAKSQVEEREVASPPAAVEAIASKRKKAEEN